MAFIAARTSEETNYNGQRFQMYDLFQKGHVTPRTCTAVAVICIESMGHI